MARAEIGDQKVQAMDYAYTLQGWIKGVNSETLNSSRDMGKDGLSGNLNQYVGSDASGYTLAYFSGDYAAIGGTSAQTFMASVTGNTALATDTKDLYNGNISRMVTAMTNAENDLTARAVLPRMTSYKYDQLNRIKQVKSYEDINFSTNAWGNNNNDSYKETFAYDSNGNITDLTRNQKYIGTGTPVKLDDMHYNYEKIGVDASYKKYTNKLRWVDETVTTAGINDDIEDQTKDNYEYDDIGNLTFDRKEEIDKITWTVYGKVKEVKRCSTSTKYDLEFLYDATGKRIAKIKKPAATKADATTWTTTWYMHDATGNVMATYEYKNPLSTDKFCLKEQMIYGSSRLGICQVDLNLLTAGTTLSPLSERILGNKYYEQSNHLGNVLTVVSDKKIPYDAEGTNLVPNPSMDNQTSGLATNWAWLNSTYTGTASIVTGNGFTGNAQRIENSSGHIRVILRNLYSTVGGKSYRITLKYRSNINLKLSGNTGLSAWGITVGSNTGDAVEFSYIVTTTGNETGFSVDLNVASVAGSYWAEFDDVKVQDAEGIIDSYQASVISTSDYYAFGSPIYDRTHYASEYKYGFNGQERDEEIASSDYDFGARIYESRLGRFLSRDPLTKNYPYWSPYVFAGNNPIALIDLLGMGPKDPPKTSYTPDPAKLTEAAVTGVEHAESMMGALDKDGKGGSACNYGVQAAFTKYTGSKALDAANKDGSGGMVYGYDEEGNKRIGYAQANDISRMLANKEIPGFQELEVDPTTDTGKQLLKDYADKGYLVIGAYGSANTGGGGHVVMFVPGEMSVGNSWKGGEEMPQVMDTGKNSRASQTALTTVSGQSTVKAMKFYLYVGVIDNTTPSPQVKETQPAIEKRVPVKRPAKQIETRNPFMEFIRDIDRSLDGNYSGPDGH